MANFGKRPINNAGHAQKVRQAVAFYHGGELRLDRRPYGKIERFVDPVGNVITLQMATPGDAKARDTELRLRAEKHADGWVEHAKCPLRHGTRNVTVALQREFAKMPKDIGPECTTDPKVMERVNGDLHALNGCPHIEWLIASRRATEAAAAAKRNEKRAKDEKRAAEAAELQAMQLEIVKEQVEERKARKREKKAPTE